MVISVGLEPEVDSRIKLNYRLERCAKQKKLVRRRTQEESPLKHKISPFSEHIEPSGRLRNILYIK